MTVTHIPSPDEPVGGWLSPAGPGQWLDLIALDRRQRGLPPLPDEQLTPPPLAGM